MTNTNMQFAVLDVDADAPENQTIDPELEVRMGCVLSENFVFTILYQTCKMWRTKKARLVQDGEFIDVFLLPYDGLYDALVVSTLVIYPGEISCVDSIAPIAGHFASADKAVLMLGSGNSHC